nr:integrase, catalytic region, zinc finger, CCHC-type, peptidase aspartic, catalytic [Tanacetum cinerariifolium]
MQDKAKKSCMGSFRLLHSLLKVLSNNDLKGTRIKGGFERAFVTLFEQDVQTFTRTMLLNLDQLEKHLAKEEFQELESFSAFRVLLLQFQTFIYSQFSLDNDEGLMIHNGTESEKHDTSSRSGNDTHAEDADIKPVNDKEPMVEVQLTAQNNVLANEEQHSVQSEPIYDTYLLEKKCVFNANHDACITKFLKEVNSRVKVQSRKTRNSNKPVEPKIHTQKLGRQIVTRHRSSSNKSSDVHEKAKTLRSCLRWISTGRIFNTVGLRWVPTGKTFISSITKVECEPPNGSNEDITNPYECDQTLNVSAGTLNLTAGTSFDLKNQVPQGIHKQKQSPNSSQGVKEQQKRTHSDDPCHELLHRVYISQGSSLNIYMDSLLRSKDETPKVLIDFLKLVQRGLHSQVRIVRTDKGTDGENLDKMKEKGDACIFVGYSTQSRAYRVFNKRTRVVVETIHVNFDELPHMASDHVSSYPVPQCQRTTLEHDSLSPGPQRK